MAVISCLSTLRTVLNVPHGLGALGLTVLNVLLDLLDVQVSVDGSARVSLERMLDQRRSLTRIWLELNPILVSIDYMEMKKSTTRYTYVCARKPSGHLVSSDFLPVDCVLSIRRVRADTRRSRSLVEVLVSLF